MDYYFCFMSKTHFPMRMMTIGTTRLPQQGSFHNRHGYHHCTIQVSPCTIVVTCMVQWWYLWYFPHGDEYITIACIKGSSVGLWNNRRGNAGHSMVWFANGKIAGVKPLWAIPTKHLGGVVGTGIASRHIKNAVHYGSTESMPCWMRIPCVPSSPAQGALHWTTGCLF